MLTINIYKINVNNILLTDQEAARMMAGGDNRAPQQPGAAQPGQPDGQQTDYTAQWAEYYRQWAEYYRQLALQQQQFGVQQPPQQ